ncbi:LacI family DNA-binding transcriptional regulator [Sphingobacterium pedocola]|uniref:LacI family DNA-binding transcriptional regulator n=1 Tax=Sphingobacterium pedocola TaxID=2082722 RepID=UPI0018C9FCEE|nr:LacI family DNA-binding transcriptional regulator [Sphingobacterium pedocola]
MPSILAKFTFVKYRNYTLKDVAQDLGLSTSTVSRALRDSHEISEETKKKVLDYAAKVKFKINPIARSLKERKSQSIGIVVSEIANNFFSQIVNGIESVAHQKNYHVIISQSHESSEKEKMNIEHLASRSVDGLLISLSSETKDIDYIKDLYNRGLPIVFFDRIPNNFNTFTVVSDNFQGAYKATEEFILSGKKRIAHLTNSKSLSITQSRLNGYKAALDKHNVVFDERLIQYCPYGGMHMEEINRALDHFLQEGFDSIFISGDRLTAGFLLATKEKNVAHDFPIAGFTNSDFIQLFSPKITVIRQNAFEMGKTSVELLIKMIETKYPITEFEQIVLPVQHS